MWLGYELDQAVDRTESSSCKQNHFFSVVHQHNYRANIGSRGSRIRGGQDSPFCSSLHLCWQRSTMEGVGSPLPTEESEGHKDR